MVFSCAHYSSFVLVKFTFTTGWSIKVVSALRVLFPFVNCLSTDCQSFIFIIEHLNYELFIAKQKLRFYNMFDLREVGSFSIVGLDVSDPVI